MLQEHRLSWKSRSRSPVIQGSPPPFLPSAHICPSSLLIFLSSQLLEVLHRKPSSACGLSMSGSCCLILWIVLFSFRELVLDAKREKDLILPCELGCLMGDWTWIGYVQRQFDRLFREQLELIRWRATSVRSSKSFGPCQFSQALSCAKW